MNLLIFYILIYNQFLIVFIFFCYSWSFFFCFIFRGWCTPMTVKPIRRIDISSVALMKRDIFNPPQTRWLLCAVLLWSNIDLLDYLAHSLDFAHCNHTGSHFGAHRLRTRFLKHLQTSLYFLSWDGTGSERRAPQSKANLLGNCPQTSVPVGGFPLDFCSSDFFNFYIFLPGRLPLLPALVNIVSGSASEGEIQKFKLPSEQEVSGNLLVRIHVTSTRNMRILLFSVQVLGPFSGWHSDVDMNFLYWLMWLTKIQVLLLDACYFWVPVTPLLIEVWHGPMLVVTTHVAVWSAGVSSSLHGTVQWGFTSLALEIFPHTSCLHTGSEGNSTQISRQSFLHRKWKVLSVDPLSASFNVSAHLYSFIWGVPAHHMHVFHTSAQ